MKSKSRPKVRARVASRTYLRLHIYFESIYGILITFALRHDDANKS